MEFEQLITERYSVRDFKQERVSKEHVDQILSASHKAPTGCNFQPQRILVINSKESIEKLKPCTKCHFNAPTAMLICHDKTETWTRPYDGEKSSKIDAVIVATHMMLKAHEIGVGCCWVMHFNPHLIKPAFNIPENIEPVALLMMGYPSENSKPSQLHNTFRLLSETVFYDTF